MPNTKTVFIDADAFVALAKEDDTNHVKAAKLLQKLINEPVTFLTSNYVFLETVTVISLRVGHEQALKFIKQIKSPGSEFLVEWIDSTIEEQAIEVFEKQTSKNVSFVDCTNIALIRLRGIDAIFSFDEIYKKNKVQNIENLL